MATRTITTALKLDGEAAYRAALKNINSELGMHKSELQKVDALYKTNQNSVEALEAKQTALKGALDALNQKHREQVAMVEQARAAQQKYAEEAEQLRAKLDALKNSTSGNAEEEKKLTEQLAAAEANIQKAKNSANGYQQQVNKTEKEQATLNAELKQTEQYLNEARNSADQCASSIDQYGRSVKASTDALSALASVLAAAGIKAAIQEIAAALQECVEASIRFESGMAGVQRTTSVAGPDLKTMADHFKQLSTEIPIFTTELSKTAETAGQLGIAKDKVEEFTTVMAKLDTTTDLTSEAAATMLAQFANITGLTDYERLGSTVAALGDSTATTASKVVEMSQGMAAAADMAGFQETEILGLSAAVGSLGIEAQAGSTAMSTLISTLHKAVETGSDKLADFAAVADMSAEEFAAAWREDAAGAFVAFIQGLTDVERNGRSAMVILDELGITNARQVKAILGLANAGDLLSQTMDQANQAWEENTALSEKAAIMYETTEAKLIMAKNAFNNVKIAIGDALTPALNTLAEAGTAAFSWAAQVIEQNPWLVQAIAGVATALGVLVGSVTALKIVKVIKPLLLDFNDALAANPAIAVAAAISGLVVALGGFASAANGAVSAHMESIQAIETESSRVIGLKQALEDAMAVEEKTAEDKAYILRLVEELNEAVPDLALAYDAETDALNQTTAALDAQIDAMVRQKLYEANMDRLVELAGQQKEIEAALNDETIKGTTVRAAYTQALEENKKEQAELRDAIAEQTSELTGNTSAVTSNTAAMEENRSAAEMVQVEQAKLADVLNQVSGGYEVLVKAQEETAQSGNLSLSTLQNLLSKYPELERYLVETADGYALAEGALEDYIAAQRAEYQLVYDNAYVAAQDVVDAEALKASGYDTTTMSIKEQLRAMRELYTAQATAAQNAVLERYGGDTSDYAARQAMANDPTARSAVSSALAAQQALQALEAAEQNLGTYDRAAATAARSTGGSKSSGSGSQSGSTKTAAQDALAELEDWLEDMDHQIFLWSKDESKTEAILSLYRQMQDKTHAAAEQLRSEGYDDTSDEIQQLQKLWWGYSDEISALWEELYERERDALERAHAQGQITTQEYLDGLLELQNKYFSADSAAWSGAEKDRQALAEKFAQEDQKAKEAAYQEALADAKYFRDLNLISEQEYYAELERLRDAYLEENSSAWRSATVELYNYQQKCLEAALKELEAAYQSKLKNLQADLDQQLKALDAQLKAAQSAQKAAYQAEKDAAKEAYEEKKAAIQAELALEQDRLNAILDGINQEIQARRELREDEDQDEAIAKARKRLEAAQAQLAYARTDEDRVQWEKEVVRLQEALDKAIQDKEDTAFYREKELEKEKVNGELSAAKDAAAQKQDEAKADYDKRLDALEADYNAALEKLEAEYAAQKAKAEEQYAAQRAKAEQNYQAAAGEMRGNAGQQSLQDWQAAQVAAFNAAAGGGNTQRSKQTEASRAAADAKADALNAQSLSNSLAKVMSTAATVAAKQVQNVTTKNSSASVTINQASSLTEGQVARTVKKVLDQLDR